ncbi:AGE family epimerase/isomerase [Azospirillum sp.]|uniref:AGE family epimerase/isomerase n=1 Tax=Azospirillum sp. TaxID=34012 RepID=UPI003D74E0E2
MTLYRSRAFLLDHIRHILAFYDDHAFDPAGGFFQCLMRDGRVFDPATRSLVGSSRVVFNYALAWRQFGEERHHRSMLHALADLRQRHFDPKTGRYAWRVVGDHIADASDICYGLAFVLLAYAQAHRAGVEEARSWIYETRDLLERRFWLPADGLYASEADADGVVSGYRGQNDNMHACEAMIAAYEATGDAWFLERAAGIARAMTVSLAEATGGAVWEHFHADWSPDLEYGRGDTSNHIRPWGVQTGHQTEWAKLLLILDRHAPEPWRLPRARALFDRAMALGWDAEHGGLIYGYDLSGTPCDRDKYFWVQAESIAAAALLASASGDERYWEHYDRLWSYADKYFVDHAYGAWYRILTPDNKRYDDRKSYSNKMDYHTMGACYEVLNVV